MSFTTKDTLLLGACEIRLSWREMIGKKSTKSKCPSYLVKEDLGLAQDMLQLGQLQEVLLQRLRILIDLAQLVLQLLERRLQVNHLAGLRRLGTITGVQHRDRVLLDLLLQVPQLALHLIATTHLVHELALERVHVGIQLEREEY